MARIAPDDRVVIDAVIDVVSKPAGDRTPMPKPKDENKGEPVKEEKKRDARTLWLTQAGRGFEFAGEGKWKEIHAGGAKGRVYTEVARNDDYVELHADDADVYVRIHNTVYYWGTVDRQKKSRQWTQWLSPEQGTGGWKQR